MHKQWTGSVKPFIPPMRDLSCIVIITEKATCLHIRSGLTRLNEISPETIEIAASQDVNFPCETMHARQPGQPG